MPTLEKRFHDALDELAKLKPTIYTAEYVASMLQGVGKLNPREFQMYVLDAEANVQRTKARIERDLSETPPDPERTDAMLEAPVMEDTGRFDVEQDAIDNAPRTPTPEAAPAPRTLRHGEVVAWELTGCRVTRAVLEKSLAECELDPKEARKFLPSNAFCRALHSLSENRIVRMLKNDVEYLSFQFTKEFREQIEGGLGERLRYDFEAVLSLNKKSGVVSCTDDQLAKIAQEKLDDAMELRTTSDITNIVGRLFHKNADLFAIRTQGGCYFVPEAFSLFTDQVEKFLRSMGGKMQRFPVPKGTVTGDRSVKESVATGIAQLISEHMASIDKFGEDTRESTLKRHAANIDQTRMKIQAYSEYLQGEKERLEASVATAKAALKEKVNAISAAAAQKAAAKGAA